MKAYERFLKYVSVWTTSDENSETVPSADRELVLAKLLAEEMKDTGVKIAAVDEQEDSLDALEKGELSVLAAQSGYDIGYQTIKYIGKICSGEETEQNQYLDAEILTIDNLEEYRREHANQKYKE